MFSKNSSILTNIDRTHIWMYIRSTRYSSNKSQHELLFDLAVGDPAEIDPLLHLPL